jgi:hypothetical protein
MRKQILKWRRDRWAAQAVRTGERLRDAQVYRAGLNASILPDEARIADNEITHLQRRQERLLTKLKETHHV